MNDIVKKKNISINRKVIYKDYSRVDFKRLGALGIAGAVFPGVWFCARGDTSIGAAILQVRPASPLARERERKHREYSSKERERERDRKSPDRKRSFFFVQRFFHHK